MRGQPGIILVWVTMTNIGSSNTANNYNLIGPGSDHSTTIFSQRQFLGSIRAKWARIEKETAHTVNVKHEIPILHNNKTLGAEVKICETQTCWWSAAGPSEYFRPKFLSPGVTLCWSHSGSGQLGARLLAWEKMIRLIRTQRLTRPVTLAWCLGPEWTTPPLEPEPTSSSRANSPALSCQEDLSPRQIGF